MLRLFDPDRDREAARRIWREAGWLDHVESVDKEASADRWITAGRAFVAEVNGDAECVVTTAPGTLSYLCEELPLSCVTGVTTSRVARKQGHALRVTSRAVAEDVRDGAIVAGLGMFEQGFYNRIGFGTGAYGVKAAFDPGQLTVRTSPRVPTRLKASDWEAVHAARIARPRRHGQCTVFAPVTTRAPMEDSADRFGLGYRDAVTGEITHHFWCVPKGSHGPYRIEWLVYHTGDQFLELMGLLRGLGDQVRLVSMQEPPEIQLQDLMQQPFKQIRVSAKSDYAAGLAARAVYQYRICNLAVCLERTHLSSPDVLFNLLLTDPIEDYLDANAPWRGTSGEYVVSLGKNSGAEPGRDDALPDLNASIGAFTRLWLGVRPASGLAVTDDLYGPQELLELLDSALRLPMPINDWDF